MLLGHTQPGYFVRRKVKAIEDLVFLTDELVEKAVSLFLKKKLFLIPSMLRQRLLAISLLGDLLWRLLVISVMHCSPCRLPYSGDMRGSRRCLRESTRCYVCDRGLFC